MKSSFTSNWKNADANPPAHKAVLQRNSSSKHAAHRYERRKLREFLRHSVDSEDESSRFERFG